jgi:c-di-GMP-binding flagellar brake protein YcgR
VVEGHRQTDEESVSNMIDKRKYIRLNACIGASYRVKKIKNKVETAVLVKNIGGGGLRLQVKEDFRAGDLLELEVQIPHLEQPIQTTAEVVWFSHFKSKDRDLKEAGVRFRDIDAKDLHHILEYVHAIGIG